MELKTHDKRLKLTNGDFQRLVKARKPEGIEEKSAYLVGTGIAALTAACFLIRDAHMEGKKITFLEQLDIPGGSLDGKCMETRGYVARGGRETGAHFECLWDIWRSIPSIEDPEMSVLDSYFYTNYDDPNYSNCRITHKQGEKYDDGNFNLTQEQVKEIADLCITKDEDLNDKTIEEVFSEGLLNSDFWTYWRTMFAFENWHSALEMKLYLNRFIHHVDGFTDLSAARYTRYDQYNSIVKPMVKYLEDHGCNFQYDIKVTDVDFDISENKKVATKIIAEDKDGNDKSIDLSENDLLFITNGSMTENSIYGDDNTAAELSDEQTGCWEMWKNIAKKSDDFGHPEVFCSDVEKSNWESCTITCHDDSVTKYIEKITKRNPHTGKTVTGGLVTCVDSSWLISWTINRQGQYPEQNKNDVAVWLYGLFTDVEGDYIKKKMRDCTGKEITKEWLFHIGVPVNEIDDLAETCTAVPVMMPYITAQFMPRKFGDRPYVVPKDGVNFAFLGQFAETLDDPGRDTVFTTEYSGRTAMEAVYVLCGVEKAVPEVFASRYDLRYLLNGMVSLSDGKKPELPLSPLQKMKVAKLIKGTDIEEMLKEFNII
ncbi:MAG: oleate hydratase [Peptoniphilus rhinitidis]|uniref:oleate hydratase n=1 Tax=Peptoniphilus rhinitidis TaxID=1175452 RepID=UPI0029037CFA|nr:oleate hydratase [Peptoniphilus rhinitidis]MDU2109441.1 oleate hydratase [Peptoniphilus lacydonensis]MDU3751057.1 oleate hydratase [Peptoniphilus rhinitidis]